MLLQSKTAHLRNLHRHLLEDSREEKANALQTHTYVFELKTLGGLCRFLQMAQQCHAAWSVHEKKK